MADRNDDSPIRRRNKGKAVVAPEKPKRKRGRTSANPGAIIIRGPPPEPEQEDNPMSDDEDLVPEEPPSKPRKRDLVPPLIHTTLEGRPYDQTRFLDKDAYQAYVLLEGRTVIHDRGFTEADLRNPLIYDAIVSRGWQEWVRHPDGLYSWELTRLFLINCRLGEYKSWIAGTVVPYDAATINAMYGVVDVPEERGFWDPIFTDANRQETRQMVLEAMFEQQDAVVYYPGSGRKRVDGTKMDAPFYQLHQLVRSRLMPASHTSGPSADCLYVVYCMKNGRPINIGECIAGELQDWHKSTRRISLIFPALIWRLCERAGVNLEQYERNLKMKAPIPFTHHFNLPGTRCRLMEIGPQAEHLPEMPEPVAPARGRGAGARGRGRGRAPAPAGADPGAPLDLHRLQEQMYEIARQHGYRATDRHDYVVGRINKIDRKLSRMIARQEHVYAQLLGPRYVQPSSEDSSEESEDEDFDEEAAPGDDSD